MHLRLHKIIISYVVVLKDIQNNKQKSWLSDDSAVVSNVIWNVILGLC